jgi:hypothetical protein
MKRIIFSVLLMSTLVIVSHAQKFRLGLAPGVDASRMAISGASGGPLVYRTDIAGGIFGEAVISPTFSVQLEANYSAQGAGVINEDGSTAGSYQLNYITIPLLAKLYGNPNLSFFAGPQLGILMDAKTKSSGDPETDVKEQIESIDFYGVFGAEYRFTNGVFVSGRYNVGLSNVIQDKSSNTEIKNRYFSFRVGYSFALGK